MLEKHGGQVHFEMLNRNLSLSFDLGPNKRQSQKTLFGHNVKVNEL